MRFGLRLTIGLMPILSFAASQVSAEIFEDVHDYDVDACDIEAGDFNNDGLDDFIVVDFLVSDSSYYEVFLSNGDCSFTRLGQVYVDTSDIGRILLGDFNEDSNKDLLLMSLDDTWLYLGDGTGSFSDFSSYNWAVHDGCVADLNGDEHLDIVGIFRPQDSDNSVDYDTVLVMNGDGTGGFTKGWSYDDWPHYAYQSCQAAFHGNLSTDSILDLCVPCIEGFLIFEGIGDGSFLTPDYYQSVSIYNEMIYSVCGDFNEDGYADIALSSEYTGMSTPSTYIFLNQQDGTFEDLSGGYFIGACCVYRIATADLDLDGHLDLSLGSSIGGSIGGYGDGFFNDNEPLSNIPGVDFVFIDMDLDGDLDHADQMGYVDRNTIVMQSCEEESEGSMINLVLDVSPNPFSTSVSIEVSGYSDGSENLQIFDLSGRLVDELEPDSSDGEVIFHWDGVSSSGTELPSGIYTARVRSGVTVAAVTLLKLE